MPSMNPDHIAQSCSGLNEACSHFKEVVYIHREATEIQRAIFSAMGQCHPQILPEMALMAIVVIRNQYFSKTWSKEGCHWRSRILHNFRHCIRQAAQTKLGEKARTLNATIWISLSEEEFQYQNLNWLHLQKLKALTLRTGNLNQNLKWG